MHVFYSPVKNVLIYIGSEATPDFWDTEWARNYQVLNLKPSKKTYVTSITKKYLSSGSSILEGGCGTGVHVKSLAEYGFKATGIDFADKTVQWLNDNAPYLDIQYGDVRLLPFKSNTFDGYWSLGVIEHFWGGYQDILCEAYRVLKPGGHLFLTFPVISGHRQLKISNNEYRIMHDIDVQPADFYQFALSIESVLLSLKNNNFSVIRIDGLAALKGVKDETNNSLLQKILVDIYLCDSIYKKIIAKLLSYLLPNKYFGHSALIVATKNVEKTIK
jgi:SAM-dependent methyltransferase